MTVTASNDDSISVPFTPRNVRHVDQIVQQIKAGNCDPALPEKLSKAYSSALATNTLFQITNDDLIQAEQRKKGKAQRERGHCGKAQVMNLEVVQEREDEFAAKLLTQKFRRMRVRPNFFKSPKRGRSPTKRKIITPSTPDPLTLAPPPAWKPPPQEVSSEDFTTDFTENSSEEDSPQAVLQAGSQAGSEASPQASSPASPQASPQQQQSQRGGRGSARGGARGGAREGVKGSRGGTRGGARGGARGGTRGGKKAVAKEIVEEPVVEEPLVFSRKGRPIKPKQW